MTRYPLEELRRIRARREDRAARELARERQALADARREVANRQEALADFVRRRPEEEETLFRRVAQRAVRSLDLDEYRAGVEALNARQAELRAAIEQAKAAEAEAVKRCDQARDAYRQRSAELTRLGEHKTLWEREQALEQNAREERELEDLKSRAAADDLVGVSAGEGEFDDDVPWVDPAPDPE